MSAFFCIFYKSMNSYDAFFELDDINLYLIPCMELSPKAYRLLGIKQTGG